ncbi:MAG: major capsid protein [Planctomycetota bacterium]|jgi:hypothetical protein
MPQPDVYSVHVDRPLTNISVAYIQEQGHFISTKVFPVIAVDKRSDQYWSYTQADWFRDEARPRADSTESAGSGYNVSTDSYNCNVHAIHKDVGDQVVANSDNPLNPRADATRFVTHKMLLKQESEWVTDYFATSKWGTDRTGGTHFTQWNNYATSDPIEDIEAGKETILNNTGFMPNTLVLGYQVFRKLKHHPDIVDRMKYTTPVVNSTVDSVLLAAMFGVDRVLVALGIENTAVEGATASYSFFLGKNALLAYVAPRASLLTPTAGYTFVWNGVSQGLGNNVGIKAFRMEHLAAERIEGQMSTLKVISLSSLTIL